ncbi:hypothetical protein OROMI_008046 [Orobanche minor]
MMDFQLRASVVICIVIPLFLIILAKLRNMIETLSNRPMDFRNRDINPQYNFPSSAYSRRISTTTKRKISSRTV